MKERVRWKPGSNYKISVEVAQEKIDEIRARNNGICVPADIVQEAKKESSPLHKAGFTWNVKKAAQERWEDQARRLVRSIEIVRVDDEGHKSSLPMYVSIAKPYVAGPAYTSTGEAMADPVSRDIIVALGQSQLEGWKQRFGKLSEFAEHMRALDAIAQAQAKQQVA